MTEIGYAPAHRLAALIRDRQVSAVEVVEALLARIERHNPAINAVVTLDAEGARSRAKAADAALARGESWGALHGVPVTIKDALATAGLRTTGGYEPLAEYVPAQDATVVARLKAAGAIVLGKTNLPVLSMDFQASNPIFGRTNNPWNLERIPGGSTGGGAAAVAAGLTPLDVGSDVGGSVRLPAHCCGVLALKPTEHRIPTTGHIPELPDQPRIRRHMNTVGPLARSVEDLRLALMLMAGPDGRDWEVPPARLDPAPPRDVRGLRLAWAADFGTLPASAETRAALAGLAGKLAAAGATVEQAVPAGFDFEAVWETRGALGEATGRLLFDLADPERAAARRAELERQPGGFNPMRRGSLSAIDPTMRRYVEILARRDGLIAALERFLAGVDAFLCPVMPQPAIPHWPEGEPIPIDGREFPYGMAGAGFTTPFNLTGNPVVVLPIAVSADGLPIGVQIVGPRWGELPLLAVAEAIQSVAGPFRAPPGY